MKFKKLFAFLLAAPLFLGSCVMNNGICYEHVDANKDGICDVCGSVVKSSSSEGGSSEGGGGSSGGGGDIPGNPCTTHIDHDLDGKCDNCGADMSIAPHDHIDADQNGSCDICGANMIVCNDHKDNNGDGYCDICGAVMPNVPAGTEVTIYLVLSSVGTLDGITGITYGDFNLEYAHRLIAKVGDPLPGKDRVKHLYQSADFEAWVAYEGAGAPTVYTTVPGVNNKILYAQFTPNGTTPVVPDPDPDPSIDTTTTQYTLKTNFAEGNWSVDSPLIVAYAWLDSNSRVFAGTQVDENTYTFDIYKSYTSMLFLRLAPGTPITPFDWEASKGNIWNQSEDISVVAGKTVAQITSWGNGTQGRSTVMWVS